MSVKGMCNELLALRKDIKKTKNYLSNLRKREKVLEEEINNYLVSRDLPGFKHQGLKFKLKPKTRRRPKKKREKLDDSLYILEKYNVENPQELLKELMEARRGVPEDAYKLNVERIKQSYH